MKKKNCVYICVIILSFLSVSCSKKDSDPSGDNATSVPTAPANLIVTNVDASSVKLTWTDASNNEKGFKITRWSMMSGSGLEISVPANTTTYTDAGLNTYEYRYTVRAYNSIGDSDPSNSVRNIDWTSNCSSIKSSSSSS